MSNATQGQGKSAYMDQALANLTGQNSATVQLNPLLRSLIPLQREGGGEHKP